MKEELFFKALKFAAYRHRFSKTKNEEPYINHLISVSSLLYDTGAVHNTEVLTAALLHDILEKTNTKTAELEGAFGQKITSIVVELTDSGSESEKEKWEHQLKKIDMLSWEAKVIKLADKIENVSSIISSPPKGWDMDRRIVYIEWTEKIIHALQGTNLQLESYFEQLLEKQKRNNPMFDRLFSI